MADERKINGKKPIKHFHVCSSLSHLKPLSFHAHTAHTLYEASVLTHFVNHMAQLHALLERVQVCRSSGWRKKCRVCVHISQCLFYWRHTEVKSTVKHINYSSIAHMCFCSAYSGHDVSSQSWPRDPGAYNSPLRTPPPAYTTSSPPFINWCVIVFHSPEGRNK